MSKTPAIDRGEWSHSRFAATWHKEHEPDRVATFREAGKVDRHASPERRQSRTTGPISLETAAREVFGGESVETSRNGFSDGLP